jgi:endonuclease/exonuclease/phosphatase family metal-dependent hydrolase
MTCLHCSHSQMRHESDDLLNKQRRAMAKRGFAACTLEPGAFRPFAFSCKHLRAIDGKTREARDAWAAKQ